ncbi:MAG: SGNH/GDSL hydrolase family protein [Gemmatimonadota bacterium]
MTGTPDGPLRRAGALVRRGWNALGIVLLFGLCLGVGFALASSLSRALPREKGEERPGHPYAGEAWFPTYNSEFQSSLMMRWSPYVYWQRQAFAGQFINVDSTGFRRTIQAAPVGANPRRVWFFGGSTLWGTWQRDSHTIPSLVSAGLSQRGITNVEVRNFGETGYVFTQEVLRLVLELQAGERPDVVVFYDGANDLAASTMSPSCGIAQNEERRAFEFAFGRLLTSGRPREFRDFGRLFILRARNQINDMLVGNGLAQPRRLDTGPLATGVVRCYARTAGLVEALSREYGFRALYFWQPMPATSPKPATVFEQPELDTLVHDGLREHIRSLDRIASAAIDSAMTPIAHERFHNLSALFTGDTATVWMDFIGHITERANGVVVGRMIDPVAQALEAPAREPMAAMSPR